MRIRNFAVTTLLALTATAPALADVTVTGAAESELGSVAVAQTVALMGTITAIDPVTREVSLQDSDGMELAIICGPEVRNFDQLRVGDVVEIEHTQALALELRKGSTAEISRTVEGALAAAAPGETPAGIGGIRVSVVAEVLALDPETQMVTLQVPDRTVALKINDPEQFSNIDVGDRIEGTYVEAVAVQVTHTDVAD